MRSCTMPSPLGELLLRATDRGLAAVLMPPHDDDLLREAHDDGGEGDPVLALAQEQLAEYFAGTRTSFDLPLDLSAGTPFQQSVWGLLLEVPYGETTSYGALAQQLGSPGASRAVGAANGRNPVSLVVPCHRVVGSNGAVTGYAGGLDRKHWLLAHERSGSGEALF